METQETNKVSSDQHSDTPGGSSDVAARRRIVTLARRRFMAEGFSTVRTEDLAKELGMSKKTLYRLFDTKNQIVMEVARSLIHDIDTHLTPIFDGGAPFPQTFQRLLGEIIHYVGGISPRFMTDLSRYAPEVWEEIDRFRRERVLSRIERAVRRGIEEGTVDDRVHPRLLVTFVQAIYQNVLTPDLLMRLSVGPQDIAALLLRLCNTGILTERGREHLQE